jgi:hypothetical protein
LSKRRATTAGLRATAGLNSKWQFPDLQLRKRGTGLEPRNPALDLQQREQFSSPERQRKRSKVDFEIRFLSLDVQYGHQEWTVVSQCSIPTPT